MRLRVRCRDVPGVPGAVVTAPRAAQLNLRVAPASLDAWRRAASAEALSLSEWLHRLADAAAGIDHARSAAAVRPSDVRPELVVMRAATELRLRGMTPAQIAETLRTVAGIVEHDG